MGIRDDLGALRPAWLVSADTGVVVSDPGRAAVTDTGVGIVPGGGGRVMRFAGGDVTVSGVSSFSSDNEFTVAVWFRCERTGTAQRLFGRVNGGTSMVLEVTGDGTVRAVVSSASGGYSTAIPVNVTVTNGEWWCVVLRAERSALLGVILTDELRITLTVGSQQRHAWMKPPLFGRAPQLGLSTPIVLGRAMDGSTVLRGDIAVAAAWRHALPDTTVDRLVSATPDTTPLGFTGWGIELR